MLCEHMFIHQLKEKGPVHKYGTLVGKLVFHGGMDQQF